MLASTCGVVTAAAQPCTRRATTRNSIVGALAVRRAVIARARVPARNMRRRPHRSPRRPKKMRPAAKVAEYAPTTREVPDSEICRPYWMPGAEIAATAIVYVARKVTT